MYQLCFQKSVIPRLKSWVRKIASEDENIVAPKTDSIPSVAEEATAAAKAVADAAAQVAKASLEMMNMNIEGFFFKTETRTFQMGYVLSASFCFVIAVIFFLILVFDFWMVRKKILREPDGDVRGSTARNESNEFLNQEIAR